MRRGQYGRRIEYHTHPKYGGNVPIFLDSGRALFTAILGDFILQDENLEKLRRLVDDSLKKTFNLEWIPIIEITFGSRWAFREDRDRNALHTSTELEFKRYWIAQKIDSFWIEASWEVEHYPEFGKKVVSTGDRLERSRAWTDFEEDDRSQGHKRIPLKTLTLPRTKKASDRDETPTYYVAYSEDLWKTLKEISKRMDDLQKKLIQILGSTEKRNALVEHLNKLLPLTTKGESSE